MSKAMTQPGEFVTLEPGVKVPQLRRATYFRCTSDFLVQLLQLPEGAEICAVDIDVTRHSTLRFYIDGAGWPVQPGDTLREARPLIYNKPATVAMQFEWDFQGAQR